MSFSGRLETRALKSVRQADRRGAGQGEKSENIRLNQMQIERFAVGNFQFSSPVGARESSRTLSFCSSAVQQASVLSSSPDSDTGKTNLELIFCRRVSFRFDTIRFARGWFRGSRCEFTGKSGWLLPGMCLLLPVVCFLLVGFTGSFVRSFVCLSVRSCVCAFNYFLPWRSLFR